MTVKSLQNRFNTIKKLVRDNEISKTEAEDKAISLLGDALYTKNKAEQLGLTYEDIIAVERLISYLDEFISEIQKEISDTASL